MVDTAMTDKRTLIRLPNWLGDVVMALPVIRGMAAQQPLCLRGLPVYGELLPLLGIELPFVALPAKGALYYLPFWRERGRYARAVHFTNSQRGDTESWLAGIPERYGIAWPGRPRRLLNRRFSLPVAPEADKERHQTQLWADFIRHFSLSEHIDTQPVAAHGNARHGVILLPGSENSPEKRWPLAHWQALAAALLADGVPTWLCGTTRDRDLCDAIAGAHPGVRNLAGQTTLAQLVQYLAGAQLVIGNDSGGLHLANAVATPVIGLYGPTNPRRSAPVHTAPLAIVQPSGCPPTGGGYMADIHPVRVIALARSML